MDHHRHHHHRIFIFLFLVITTTFITTSSSSRSSTFQWSSLDEESQARISGQVYQEVRLFDRLLGTLLARKAERAWRAEVAPKQDLPKFEDVNEETERYLETLALWAKSRYYDLLHCSSSNDDEKDVLENIQPAEVLRKYFVCCQYLKTLLTRYYYSADDEDNSTVAAKDSADSFAKESMAKLAALYRTMPAVEYRGRRYQGEDALEQLTMMMTSAEDESLLKKLWTARSRATVGLSETFREIMATLASSGRGEVLWNRWNADLGIVPANRSLSLAVELWSGQLREFYDLLLDFIAHRLELSRDKNGSIEVQKLGSFSATSFDRLLVTSKKRIIPFPEVLQEGEEEEKNSAEENSFQELLQKAQEVFTRLGFEKLPERYWENSIFKEDDKFGEVNISSSCHPLTFYFFRRADVRTRMCYQKNDPRSSWRRVLHELGHAHYYLAYDNASLFNLYKSRPNSAIHEAIGEAVILLQDGCQAASKESSQEDSPKSLINRLLSEAVTSFVRLPYALSLERWRHELMTGEEGGLSVREMNSRYWEIREEVSRVKAPENDEDEDDDSSAAAVVDALSKYHVAFFMPYLRYFYGTLMMHQIQATLCREEQGSILANCCPKAEAMERFREFLARGALPEEYLQSNWDVLTGGSIGGGGETWGYSSGPLLEYYRPLIEWLKEYKELLLENQL